MGMWRKLYSFRNDEMEDDELKEAYHEGMKDGYKRAKREMGMSFRHDRDMVDDGMYGERSWRISEDRDRYGERSRDSYGRYR